jgi:hypothetical protein
METFENKYVAFCDILGFSNKVLSDFEDTVNVYREFKKELVEPNIIEVDISIVSDSIMIVSDDFFKVAEAVQILVSWTCSRKKWLVRGGVAYGKHWEQRDGNNLLVVSEALVKAVNIEKAIKHPIIAVSDEIPLGLEYWLRGFGNSVFSLPIINYDNTNIVNPFNNYWFGSAEVKLKEMKNDNPTHATKHDYLLDLIEAIKRGDCFIPQAVIDDLLEKKIIGLKPI